MKIKDIQKGIKNKQFSVRELVEKKLILIGEKDKDLNSFITVDGDNALERANEIDKLLKQGEDLPLAGVCIGIKDNILVKGIRCTAGSNILQDYTSVYNATVVEKLKNEGAIILGKLNLDEFAMGSSGEYSAFGITKNPIDDTLVPVFITTPFEIAFSYNASATSAALSDIGNTLPPRSIFVLTPLELKKSIISLFVYEYIAE